MLNKKRKELLVQNLKSISSQVRVQSVEQLEKFPMMSAEEKITHIEVALSDTEELVRDTALAAIMRLKGETQGDVGPPIEAPVPSEPVSDTAPPVVASTPSSPLGASPISAPGLLPPLSPLGTMGAPLNSPAQAPAQPAGASLQPPLQPPAQSPIQPGGLQPSMQPAQPVQPT